MPDFSKFSEKLSQYIEQVKLHHTEASKAFLFLEFIRKVFPDIEIDKNPYLEKYLKTEENDKDSTIVIRGRADGKV